LSNNEVIVIPTKVGIQSYYLKFGLQTNQSNEDSFLLSIQPSIVCANNYCGFLPKRTPGFPLKDTGTALRTRGNDKRVGGFPPKDTGTAR